MREEDKQRMLEEENRRIRRLRVLVDLTRSVLYQDPSLSLAEAREMVYGLRQSVIALFPGKESTFDLILLPRFERIIQERWGENLDTIVN